MTEQRTLPLSLHTQTALSPLEVCVIMGLVAVWHLPRSGMELVPFALAGGFLTTGPPGKSQGLFPFQEQIEHYKILLYM